MSTIVNQNQDDFLEVFASVRGGLVTASDISQLIAGGSTGIMLGTLIHFKTLEWFGGQFLFGIGSYLCGFLVAVASFYLIEWIQSKSWSTFYDDVLPGKFKNSTGIAKAYRVILNVFLFTLSLMCAIASMSTSYWASEDAGDAMVEDVQMVDLGAIAAASVKAQSEYNTSTDSKIATLQKEIESLQSGRSARMEEAKNALGSKMLKLAAQPSDQWAKKQVSVARAKAAAKVDGEIEDIRGQIREAEREKARTIRDMSASNTHAIQISSAQYNKNSQRVEKKETRNKWIFVIITVGGSIMFISSQTLLGFDRAIAGISYQEQRMYAPDGVVLGFIGGLFDPVYDTRGESHGIKVAKPTLTAQKSKRGRPSGSKKNKSGYKAKTPFGKLLKSVGVKAESELKEDGDYEKVTDGSKMIPIPNNKGMKYNTKKANKTKEEILKIYYELADTNQELGKKPPIAADVNKLTNYSYSTVHSILKSEGLI